MSLSVSKLRKPVNSQSDTVGKPHGSRRNAKSKPNASRNAPVWRACAGKKMDGRQVTFRIGADADQLLGAALSQFNVEQTTLMITALLEFCDRYNITLEPES